MLGLKPVAHLAAGAVMALCLSACAQAVTPGVDAGQGETLIEKYGCGSCHAIPGVPDAHGMVGPPLEHMASRQYIAGMLRNTRDNMASWLRNPQAIVPGNAMPDLGISQDNAVQIAAYLATLK